MTLEQLRIFVAVAEREHITQAAAALNLSQPAVSAAIGTLEGRYRVKLFDRVGRGIALSEAGRHFLREAQRILDRVRAAEFLLQDLSGLRHGALRVTASQTIAGYWLPIFLRSFSERYPGVSIEVSIGNTEQAAERVHEGLAELGFIEGAVTDPALEADQVGCDDLVLVQREPGPALIDADWLKTARWVVRESGSGTRSSFADALAMRGLDAGDLGVALVLPSNEAVRTAVEAGMGVAALSNLVVSPSIENGRLHRLSLELPARPFFAVRHRERHRSHAADALLAIIAGARDQPPVCSS
jgi:DNA-binding transcriptional LysR family regulator